MKSRALKAGNPEADAQVSAGILRTATIGFSRHSERDLCSIP